MPRRSPAFRNGSADEELRRLRRAFDSGDESVLPEFAAAHAAAHGSLRTLIDPVLGRVNLGARVPHLRLSHASVAGAARLALEIERASGPPTTAWYLTPRNLRAVLVVARDDGESWRVGAAQWGVYGTWGATALVHPWGPEVTAALDEGEESKAMRDWAGLEERSRRSVPDRPSRVSRYSGRFFSLPYVTWVMRMWAENGEPAATSDDGGSVVVSREALSFYAEFGARLSP